MQVRFHSPARCRRDLMSWIQLLSSGAQGPVEIRSAGDCGLGARNVRRRGAHTVAETGCQGQAETRRTDTVMLSGPPRSSAISTSLRHTSAGAKD